MKIAATRKMVQELNKRAGGGIRFEYVTMPLEAYAINAGDIWTAYDHGDYNSSTGKFRTIKAIYPAGYYAIPRYISTAELNSIYVPGDTLAGYLDRVIECMEV